MLAALSPRHTFCLGTRYAAGVEMDKNWPLYRRVLSSGARMLALPLTAASDPMSGFFGIRKESVSPPTSFCRRAAHAHALLQFLKAKALNAAGFKIALDLLVKAHVPADAIAEVPFSFGVRAEGESKLTGAVMVRYLEQLAELYWYKFSAALLFLAFFLFVAVVMLLRMVFGSPAPESQFK